MQLTITKVFKDFTASEKNAGLVLVFCTILSLFLANSSVGEPYIHFWHHTLGFSISQFDLHFSIEHWVNDGLMTIFFLMVGLEIERELYAGELHPIKNAILPLAGALGGMLVPALIFIIFNFNASTVNGFGIPMGTDIAFALGVLALAGDRVPISIKIMLTAIAIIDDLGSILIIAFFYGSDIQYTYLVISLSIFGVLLLLNRLRVYSIFPYIVLGIGMWFFMMQSGIHPTISGVLLAFAFPFAKGDKTSPSIKLQHALHLPVAFIILPLFTLANTAIPIKTEFISGLSGSHSLGIALGLIIGKPLGILSAFYLITKLKIVALPLGIKKIDLLALGCIAGIGFTMSIFITQLAFTDETLVQSSKLIILISSAIVGFIGLSLILFKKRRSNQNRFD
jgi:NhaA family Na+:H+ antiporter